MKEIAMLSALLVAALPAAASGPRFHAFMSGYSEVPSVNTGARAEFAARAAEDWLSVEWAMAYEGLQAPITQAHIHFAQRGVNGPIIVWLCGTASNPGPAGTQTCPESGTIRGTFTPLNILASPPAQQLPAGAIGPFISAMQAGAAYVNIHTTVSGGGEVRGQIYRW